MPSSYVIGEHFEKFLQAQLASSRYQSASEVIRDGLRLLEEHEKLRRLRIDELRQLIEEGGRGGPGRPLEDVIREQRTRRAGKRG